MLIDLEHHSDDSVQLTLVDWRQKGLSACKKPRSALLPPGKVVH